jgi:hypothetical protein
MAALIEKMTEYYRVPFPTVEAARQASDALMNLATANAAAVITMVGPKRVVMWEEEGPRNKV